MRPTSSITAEAMGLRFALPEDSAALLDIYNEYIGTSVTFELTLPTEA